MIFLIFTKNGPTKQIQSQTCYLCQTSRDILSKSSVKYTEKTNILSKTVAVYVLVWSRGKRMPQAPWVSFASTESDLFACIRAMNFSCKQFHIISLNSGAGF